MSEFDVSQIAPVYYHNNCKECGEAFWTIIAQKDVCPKCEGYLTKDGEQEWAMKQEYATIASTKKRANFIRNIRGRK